jgi:hypothetical protein
LAAAAAVTAGISCIIAANMLPISLLQQHGVKAGFKLPLPCSAQQRKKTTCSAEIERVPYQHTDNGCHNLSMLLSSRHCKMLKRYVHYQLLYSPAHQRTLLHQRLPWWGEHSQAAKGWVSALG